MARHVAIERVGNRTSSLRRVNRSSFSAHRSRPSTSRAAPESWPSQIPSTFTVGSRGNGARSEEQVLHERIAVVRRAAPDADVRGAEQAPVLVAGYLRHPEAATERLD